MLCGPGPDTVWECGRASVRNQNADGSPREHVTGMRCWPLLAALWALQPATATNGTQPAAPTNGTRVAVLLPGEMRFPDFDNLAASLAAFDVFISTYTEYEDHARRLRPKGLVLTPRAEVSLASGRMYQWYHLDRLLREFKDALLAYDVLFRTRTDVIVVWKSTSVSRRWRGG